MHFTFLPFWNVKNILQSLADLSCAACCDRICLLSTRKFVWVLLGPGLVTPGPKQIQPAAGFLFLFFFFFLSFSRGSEYDVSQHPKANAHFLSLFPVESQSACDHQETPLLRFFVFFCFDVPTSCTWLQLVHGLFLSYYL